MMFTRFSEKLSMLGVWLSALSCTACFPALGALATSLGLSFLAPFEGIAINTLMPIFATLALILNSYAWYQHKHWQRGLISLIGPIAVLLTLYPFWQYAWSTQLFYLGIALMLLNSILDLIKPIRGQICHK